MIMIVLLCYPVSFCMLQLLLTGHPISSLYLSYECTQAARKYPLYVNLKVPKITLSA